MVGRPESGLASFVVPHFSLQCTQQIMKHLQIVLPLCGKGRTFRKTLND